MKPLLLLVTVLIAAPCSAAIDGGDYKNAFDQSKKRAMDLPDTAAQPEAAPAADTKKWTVFPYQGKMYLMAGSRDEFFAEENKDKTFPLYVYSSKAADGSAVVAPVDIVVKRVPSGDGAGWAVDAFNASGKQIATGERIAHAESGYGLAPYEKKVTIEPARPAGLGGDAARRFIPKGAFSAMFDKKPAGSPLSPVALIRNGTPEQKRKFCDDWRIAGWGKAPGAAQAGSFHAFAQLKFADQNKDLGSRTDGTGVSFGAQARDQAAADDEEIKTFCALQSGSFTFDHAQLKTGEVPPAETAAPSGPAALAKGASSVGAKPGLLSGSAGSVAAKGAALGYAAGILVAGLFGGGVGAILIGAVVGAGLLYGASKLFGKKKDGN